MRDWLFAMFAMFALYANNSLNATALSWGV